MAAARRALTDPTTTTILTALTTTTILMAATRTALTALTTTTILMALTTTTMEQVIGNEPSPKHADHYVLIFYHLTFKTRIIYTWNMPASFGFKTI